MMQHDPIQFSPELLAKENIVALSGTMPQVVGCRDVHDR